MPKKVSRRLFVKYAGLTGAGLAGAATAPAHLLAQPPQSAATATPELLEVTVAQFPCSQPITHSLRNPKPRLLKPRSINSFPKTV